MPMGTCYYSCCHSGTNISAAIWFVWECYQIVHLLYPDDMAEVFNNVYVTNINKIWLREQEAWSGLRAPNRVKSVISHTQVTRNTSATIRGKITVLHLLLGYFPIQ